jgi:phosphoglycolate phosphatase-like HAD superfamily hydrolase
LFDLDETLINTKKRHFKVVSDFLEINGLSQVDLAEYLEKRSRGLTNSDVVGSIDPDLKEQFSVFWNSAIESTDYLIYDTSLVDTKLLVELKSRCSCEFIILSLRSNAKSAAEQFERMPFSGLFSRRYFLPHSASTNPKIDVIEGLKGEMDVLCFVGDSYSDYQAAEMTNTVFVPVNSGWQMKWTEKWISDINQIIKRSLNEYGKG